MTEIEQQFVQAQTDVTELPERPGNLTLLRLYALFKQGSLGDIQGEKPGFTDIAGKFKFEAWEALKGTPADEAKARYVELVESLKRGEAT
ncbi:MULTISPECIES: acyl-CoA-binding protein [unclassified Caballeronia]|uniref:acyl-CoA-binding protein n=1 Tax=unclassified Caballeronia TaxID=2646786 RepID=UPI00286462AB|nr:MULTISPECIES: acyl-CoA-binding protein [unclassified Caballeronia]MDR5813106.1 acyl-CoA-binding protein [Caballeronia sp. LZ033]MDR5819937.1 acyl-CoA-binding protein [Caballeronia sp. LZ043]